MRRAFGKFAGDEAGFIISAELVSVTTIAVLGMVVGLAAVRDVVTNELNDIADAFGAVSQTYHVAGLTQNCNNWNDIPYTFDTVSQTYHVAGLRQDCNNCNEIAHTLGTVSPIYHVAGRTQNGNNWRVHASIAGFGFNDYADERDWNPMRYSPMNDQIPNPNDQ
jgi:hypothetical protein